MIDFHAHTAYRHNVSIIVSSCQHYNDQPHNIYSHILALQKATRKPRFHLVGNCIIDFFLLCWIDTISIHFVLQMLLGRVMLFQRCYLNYP